MEAICINKRRKAMRLNDEGFNLFLPKKLLSNNNINELETRVSSSTKRFK